MRTPRPRAPAWRRALALFLKILRTILGIAFVLLLVVIPVPIFFKPNVGEPARRNVPTQVKPRE